MVKNYWKSQWSAIAITPDGNLAVGGNFRCSRQNLANSKHAARLIPCIQNELSTLAFSCATSRLYSNGRVNAHAIFRNAEYFRAKMTGCVISFIVFYFFFLYRIIRFFFLFSFIRVTLYRWNDRTKVELFD